MAQVAYCLFCGREFHPASPDIMLCPEHGGPPEAAVPDLDALDEPIRVVGSVEPEDHKPQSKRSFNESNVRAEWLPGDELLGTYIVSGELGKGGMGKVYRVHHMSWNIDLAVKSPRPEYFQTQQQRDLFISEAETWVNLGLHPHIVSCYYVRTLGGIPRVFAELVEGGSLENWITQGKITTLEQALDIAIQFAWGLAYAHEQGLVHRDVKPANVLITPDGTAKVTDFGLAKSSKGMTPAYASPEQAEAQLKDVELTLQSDIWSWALSVLEIFAGRAFWYRSNMPDYAWGQVAPQALKNFLSGELEDPTIAEMPSGLAGLLADCFQHNPAMRPGGLLSVADRLIEIYTKEIRKPYERQMPKAAELRADSLNNKALSLIDFGKDDDARAVWKMALELTPGHLAVTSNYCLHSLSRQWVKSDELSNLCDALMSANPNNLEAAYTAVYLLIEVGKIKEVENLINRLWKESSDHPLVVQLAAMIHWLKGAPADAVNIIQPLIQATDDPDVLKNYARYLYQLSNFKEAKTWARKVVENIQEPGAFAEEWAAILCANGEKNTALEYLEALHVEGGHTPLTLALADLLAGFGHNVSSFQSEPLAPQAYNLYQSAIRSTPFNPRARRGYRLASQYLEYPLKDTDLPASPGFLAKDRSNRVVPPGLQEVACFDGDFSKARFSPTGKQIIASLWSDTPPTALSIDLARMELKPLTVDLSKLMDIDQGGTTMLVRDQQNFYSKLIIRDFINARDVCKLDLAELLHNGDWITGGVFFQFGKAVLVTTYHGRAYLFDATSGQCILDDQIQQLDEILSGVWQKGRLPDTGIKGVPALSLSNPDVKVTMSRNGKVGYIASREHNLIIQSGDPIPIHEVTWREALSIGISDDGRYVALGGAYGTPIRIVDVASDEVVSEFPERENIVQFIRFLGDGRHVIWSDHRSLLGMSEIETGRRCGQVLMKEYAQSGNKDLDVDADGFYVAVVDVQSSLRIYRSLLEPNCALLPRLSLPIRIERPEDFTLRQKNEGLFNRWLTEAQNALQTHAGMNAYKALRAALAVPGYSSDTRALKLMPELAKNGMVRTGLKQAWVRAVFPGNRLVALSANGVHSLVQEDDQYKIVSQSKETMDLPNLEERVETAWLPDNLDAPETGDSVLLCLKGGKIVGVDVATLHAGDGVLRDISNLGFEGEALAFSMDGKKVVYRMGSSRMGQIMNSSGILALFDIDTKRLVRQFADQNIWAISPDGSRAVARGQSETTWLGRGSNQPLGNLDIHAWGGAISTDNQFLFTKTDSLSKEVTIWNATTSTRYSSPCTSVNIIDKILLSRDLSFLVVSDSQSITWWELDWDWEVAANSKQSITAEDSFFQPARECRYVAEQPIPGIIRGANSVYRLQEHVHSGTLSTCWKAESDPGKGALFLKRAAVQFYSADQTIKVFYKQAEVSQTKERPDSSEVWINGYGIIYDSGIWPASEECPHRELVDLVDRLSVQDANSILDHTAEFLAGTPEGIFPALIGHFTDSDGFTCLVTDWIEGETLRSLVAQNMPIDVNLYLQIAKKLERLHTAGKIHGDLKPENVLVMPDHQIYLLDPGGEISGMVVTTVRYYPLMRHKLDDVQAFGIMLCEALTNQHPFNGQFWDEMPKTIDQNKGWSDERVQYGPEWEELRLQKSRVDFLQKIDILSDPNIPEEWLELVNDLILSSCSLKQAIERMEDLIHRGILPKQD